MSRFWISAIIVEALALTASCFPSGGHQSRLGDLHDLDLLSDRMVNPHAITDPKTGTTKTETKSVTITKCNNGKCKTFREACVNGKCENRTSDTSDDELSKIRNHMKSSLIDTDFGSFGKFPGIDSDFGSLDKLGSIDSIIDSFFKSHSIDGFGGPLGGNVDVKTLPDGTKVASKSESHINITRCDDDGCVTCIDEECTDADKAVFRSTCGLSTCSKDQYCNEFLECVEKGESDEDTSRPVQAKAKPSRPKVSKKKSAPKFCDSTLDCDSGYQCRSGYCLPTEERISG